MEKRRHFCFPATKNGYKKSLSNITTYYKIITGAKKNSFVNERIRSEKGGT